MDGSGMAPDGTALGLTGFDHYTLRCREDEIAGLIRFYRDVMGLRPGPRPAFTFPGAWMYLGGRPVVHVAGTLPAAQAGNGPGQTGRFDHISFAADDPGRMEAHLHSLGIPFRGSDVPGFPLYQLFFHDPVGVKVEVTFPVAEPGSRTPRREAERVEGEAASAPA